MIINKHLVLSNVMYKDTHEQYTWQVPEIVQPSQTSTTGVYRRADIGLYCYTPEYQKVCQVSVYSC